MKYKKTKYKSFKYPTPNMRDMMIPDKGWTICGMDLDRADLQVVVWDCNSSKMKTRLQSGEDIHTYNAMDIFNCTWDEVTKHRRFLAKTACHAMNYYVFARTLGIALGITTKEAQKIMNTWFKANPEIKQWHKKVEEKIKRTRRLTNAFGYQTLILKEQNTKTLQEALSWIPQSTVALVINTAMQNIYNNFPTSEVQLLLQVHDELVFQFRAPPEEILPEIKKHSLITIPYKDPLIIPVGFKISKLSWGDIANQKEIEL